MSVPKRLTCSLALFVVCGGVFTAVAGAQTFSDFIGVRYRTTLNADIGTRSYMAGTGHISSGEVVASLQMVNYSGSGMLQIGELADSNDFGGNCGSGITVVFVEWTLDDSHYTCGKTSAISAFGNGVRLAVVNTSGSQWQTYRNSVLYQNGPSGLNGYSHLTPEVNAEIYQNDQTQPNPSYAITWGPSGQTSWDHMSSSANGYKIVGAVGSGSSKIDYCVVKCYNIGNSESPFNINWAG